MAPNRYRSGPGHQWITDTLTVLFQSPKKPAQSIMLSKAGTQILTRHTKIHRVHSTCASPRVKATLLRPSIPLSIPVWTLRWNAVKSDDNLAFLPLKTASFQEAQNQNCSSISETTYETMGYLIVFQFPTKSQIFFYSYPSPWVVIILHI